MTRNLESIKDHEALKSQRGEIKDDLEAVTVALGRLTTEKAAYTQALNLADRKVEAAEKARQLEGGN